MMAVFYGTRGRIDKMEPDFVMVEDIAKEGFRVARARFTKWSDVVHGRLGVEELDLPQSMRAAVASGVAKGYFTEWCLMTDQLIGSGMMDIFKEMLASDLTDEDSADLVEVTEALNMLCAAIEKVAAVCAKYS